MRCLCGKEKSIRLFETPDEIGTEWLCPDNCFEVFDSGLSFDLSNELPGPLVWVNLRGATNDSVVLTDETGHRRYWTVPQGQPIPVLR